MKTKRILIRVVLFIVSVFALFGIVGSKGDVLTANAATNTSDLSFLLNSETQEYKVKIANRSAKEITIPMTYEGLPVTAINDSRFMGCTSLERILISSSIKTIGNNAFDFFKQNKKIGFNTLSTRS